MVYLFPKMAELDWTSFEAYEKVLKVVVRVTNRVFVGLPLCMHCAENG